MSEPATESSACTEMGAKTEAHDRFKPFAGTFEAEVRMFMGPGEPHVSTGTMTNTLDLGGRYLRQEYLGNTDSAFPNFEGRGYWGYNTVTSEYEGFWIDTASTFMQTERGAVDAAGKVWDMRGTVVNPETHEAMTKRSVITLKDRDHHSVTMYFGTPGGAEQKAMEIDYTRRA